MGFKLQIRILSYIWNIIFDMEVERMQSQEEKVKQILASMTEDDSESMKDSEGNRVMGFQGNRNE